MQTVLIKTFIVIAIAALINGVAYLSIENQNSVMNQEILAILAVTAFSASIPIILGYILSYSLRTNYNKFIYSVNILLFILNIILLIAAPLLILFFGAYFPVTFLSFSYLAVGYYVFYQTIQDINYAKENKINSEDILDDNL